MFRRSTFVATFLSTAVQVAAVAPATAANKDMEILQADVDELQRQVYTVRQLVEKQGADLQRLLAALELSPDARRAQAELNANVDSLRGDIRALASRFDETASRVSALDRRIASASQNPTAPGTTAPPAAGPSSEHAEPGTPAAKLDGSDTTATSDAGQTLFQQAYADYVRDRHELALAQFREFLERFPDNDLAGNAQYWIGMSFFNQQRFEEAVRELDLVLTRHPKSSVVPEAMYRKGVALLKLNLIGQAVLVLNGVVESYPETPAAAQASERVKEIVGNRPTRP